jgi:hypothetical protein
MDIVSFLSPQIAVLDWDLLPYVVLVCLALLARAGRCVTAREVRMAGYSST